METPLNAAPLPDPTSGIDILTILYTGELRGDLALLPRLYTHLKRLKERFAPPILLLDIGEACAGNTDPDTVPRQNENTREPGDGRAPIGTEAHDWHCSVTGGRSMLVALDGMGYEAIHARITPDMRAKLGDTLRASIVGAGHIWENDGITMGSRFDLPPPDGLGRARLYICPYDAASQRDAVARVGESGRIERVELRGHVLYLTPIRSGQIGVVQIALPAFAAQPADHPIAGGYAPPRLLSADISAISPITPPDPTIAGMVDFIVGEARYLQKKAAR
jgi:hypothetical protein